MLAWDLSLRLVAWYKARKPHWTLPGKNTQTTKAKNQDAEKWLLNTGSLYIDRFHCIRWKYYWNDSTDHSTNFSKILFVLSREGRGHTRVVLRRHHCLSSYTSHVLAMKATSPKLGIIFSDLFHRKWKGLSHWNALNIPLACRFLFCFSSFTICAFAFLSIRWWQWSFAL